VTSTVRYTLCVVLGAAMVGAWRLFVGVSSSLVEDGAISPPRPPEDHIRVYLTDGCAASEAVLRDLHSTPELAELVFPVTFVDVRSDFGRHVCELQLRSLPRWWSRPNASPVLCERLQSDARAELAGMDGVVIAYPQFAADGHVIRVFESDEFLARHGLERVRAGARRGGLQFRVASPRR
jgi:hypothetical protein